MNREAWARVDRLWKEEVLRAEFAQLTAVAIRNMRIPVLIFAFINKGPIVWGPPVRFS
jgi:hypothetical protein